MREDDWARISIMGYLVVLRMQCNKGETDPSKISKAPAEWN